MVGEIWRSAVWRAPTKVGGTTRAAPASAMSSAFRGLVTATAPELRDLRCTHLAEGVAAMTRTPGRNPADLARLDAIRDLLTSDGRTPVQGAIG